MFCDYRAQVPHYVCYSWPNKNEGLVYEDKNRTSRSTGETVVEFYTKRHPHSGDAETWQQRVINGKITVNGAVCTRPDAVIPPGAVLRYTRSPWREPDAPCSLTVLYRDEHLLAVDKPAGLQVLPGGAFHQRCVLTLMNWHWRDTGQDQQLAPVPVHRLGRGTSGVLLCAISGLARTHLSKQFSHHTQSHAMQTTGQTNVSAGTLDGEGMETVPRPFSHHTQSHATHPTGQANIAKGDAEGQGMEKVYRALVAGIVEDDEGCVDVKIGRVEYPGVHGGLFAACRQGKESKTLWRVVRRDTARQQSVVEVIILTGRPHQIRIHMAAMGHPLVGDPLYAPGGLPRIPQTDASHGADPTTTTISSTGSSTGVVSHSGTGILDAPDPLTSSPVSAAPKVDLRSTGCSYLQGANAGGTMVGERGREEGFVTPGDCGYQLHCMRISFGHPKNGSRVVVSAEPPAELMSASEG